MKKCLLLAFACVLTLGMCLYAEGDKPATQTKTGTILKVDAEGQKITVKFDARPLTFAVTDDTKIAQGDEEKTLADLKEGMKVTVEYSRKSADERVAVKITINK